MHSCSRCLAIAAIAHLLQLSHCKRLALVQRAQAPTRRLRRRRADIETRRGDRRRCGSKGAGSLREFGSILGGAAITRADNKLDASSLREQTPRGVASLLGWGRRMRNMRSHGTAYSVCSRDRGSITGGQQTLLGGQQTLLGGQPSREQKLQAMPWLLMFHIFHHARGRFGLSGASAMRNRAMSNHAMVGSESTDGMHAKMCDR